MSPRKPSRPRLELSASSAISGQINEPCERYSVTVFGNGSSGIGLSLKDAKRLNAFLTKAIDYLESKRKAKRGGR